MLGRLACWLPTLVSSSPLLQILQFDTVGFGGGIAVLTVRPRPTGVEPAGLKGVRAPLLSGLVLCQGAHTHSRSPRVAVSNTPTNGYANAFPVLLDRSADRMAIAGWLGGKEEARVHHTSYTGTLMATGAVFFNLKQRKAILLIVGRKGRAVWCSRCHRVLKFHVWVSVMVVTRYGTTIRKQPVGPVVNRPPVQPSNGNTQHRPPE
jgi:hypothetical protein